MGQFWPNLVLRFILELYALAAYIFWGWTQFLGPLRYLMAVVAPLVAAVTWAVFRVPGDASAKGDAVVPVPGWLRLLYEAAYFGLAVLALSVAGAKTEAWILGIAVLVHYLLSYDRIAWLLRQRRLGLRRE